MTKRAFEVAVEATVVLTVDDAITSDFYPGETVLTAHLNPERFQNGATVNDALMSVAVHLGIENRTLSRTDGWADFPDAAADAPPWPEYTLVGVREVPS